MFRVNGLKKQTERIVILFGKEILILTDSYSRRIENKSVPMNAKDISLRGPMLSLLKKCVKPAQLLKGWGFIMHTQLDVSVFYSSPLHNLRKH